MIPSDPDSGALGPWHDVGAKTEALNFFANGRDFRIARVRAHDD
jgi:hypothetical protein